MFNSAGVSLPEPRSDRIEFDGIECPIDCRYTSPGPEASAEPLVAGCFPQFPQPKTVGSLTHFPALDQRPYDAVQTTENFGIFCRTAADETCPGVWCPLLRAGTSRA